MFRKSFIRFFIFIWFVIFWQSYAVCAVEKSVVSHPMQHRITVRFDGASLKDILKIIGEKAGINFVISGDVGKKKFTFFFRDVTIEDALESMLEANGLVYEKVGRGDIYVVKKREDARPRLVTKVFKLKYINLSDNVSLEDSSDDSQSGFTFIKESDAESSDTSDNGTEESGEAGILSVIKSLLSPSGNIEVEKHTNSLVITDIPGVFPSIEKTIEELDVLAPQVLISVRIFEETGSGSSHKGITWGGPNGEMVSATGASRVIQFPVKGGSIFPSRESLSGADLGDTGTYGSDPATGISYGILSFQQLTALLRMIEVEGKGKYLAKPSVLTTNNRPAEISIVADTAVGVQSASLISQNGLLVATAERKPTGIYMRVTPQVNADGFVTLVIEASVSRPHDSEFFPGRFVDAQNQQVNTVVTVKDQDTVRIGGLVVQDETTSVRKVPFLGYIPLLGLLFTDKQKVKVEKELNILITPKVLNRK